MKNFFDQISAAKVDSIVGISIAPLGKGVGMNSFGTRMPAGTKVSCHFHEHGEEWYIILSGQGRIHLANYAQGELSHRRQQEVRAGDIFCISENTAHQLFADSDLDFVFLCPESHLNSDRIMCDDLC